MTLFQDRKTKENLLPEKKIKDELAKDIIEYGKQFFFLSPPEAKVVRYVLEGWSNKEIGDRLCVAEKTVKFHLTNIYSMLNISRRTELFWKFPIFKDRISPKSFAKVGVNYFPESKQVLRVNKRLPKGLPIGQGN